MDPFSSDISNSLESLVKKLSQCFCLAVDLGISNEISNHSYLKTSTITLFQTINDGLISDFRNSNFMIA